jgi:hypothetical protein
METLYVDIFHKICKYLSIKDISNLQNTNLDIYKKIQCLHNNIMLRELKNFTNDTMDVIMLKDNFYIYLASFLNSSCLKYIKHNKLLYIDNNTCHQYDMNSFKFLKNDIIKNIYNRIFNFYIKNKYNKYFDDINDVNDYNELNLSFINHKNLEQYPNKLEMIVLYNFINMECFTNLYNRNYLFDFLNSLYTRKPIIDDIFYDLKYKYYSYILYVEHYTPYFIKCTFNHLNQMLPYITSISILKKLFGFKVFDLRYTKLFLCCEECVIENIYYICDLKNNFWTHDLLCHNYLEIVNFLKREKKLYYNILIQREKYLVDNKIYITNPNTNKKMKLTSSYFRKFKFELEDSCINLDRILYNKRNKLIKKYFR